MRSVETELTDCTRHFTSDQGVLPAIAPFLGPTLTPSKVSASVVSVHLFTSISQTRRSIGITQSLLKKVCRTEASHIHAENFWEGRVVQVSKPTFITFLTYPEPTFLEIT